MKSFFAILLLVTALSSEAFAQCDPLPAFPELNDISAINDFQYGTTYLARPVVANSPCKRPAPTQDEMLAYLNGLRTGTTQSKTVSGAALKDDTALLKLFGQMHDKDPRSNSEPWRYARGATVSVSPPCKDVLCAMKSIYGEELGVQMLYMRAKFGFNTSYLAMQEGDAWKPDDLGIVMAMLEDMPDQILPINEGMRFLHINAEGRGGAKMIAEALMHVYLGWHNLPESEKTTSLAHELGHVFGEGKTDKPEWLNLSGWTKTVVDGKDVWDMGRPERAVLGYAKTNPNEDFAETFFMYRYNGAAMKRRQPEKYQYMKERVFKGAEYTTPNSCAGIP